MWQAALNLKRMALVLNATGELLNLKEKEVDVPILGLLMHEGVTRLAALANGEQGDDGNLKTSTRHYCDRLDSLLKSVSTTIVEDPQFWKVYAAWYFAKVQSPEEFLNPKS